MVDLSAMRDMQAGGRYVLYVVLFAMAYGGAAGYPAVQGTMLLLVIAGTPGYWFWRRSVHLSDHDANPSPTCSHCRARLTYQRGLLERERMAQLNREYPTARPSGGGPTTMGHLAQRFRERD